MDQTLAARVGRIKPSPTLAVTAKAGELKAQGLDVLSLSAGEPDFDTPAHVKAAAIKAIDDGFTKYTPVGGTPSLKKAIIAKHQRDNGLDYAPNQVLASVGGKQACYNLCQALLNDGDEVIIPAPFWVSYPDMVLLADGKPVILPTDAGDPLQDHRRAARSGDHAEDPADLPELAVEPVGRGLHACRADRALAEVLLKHPRVIIASDDMYEKILWADEPFANIVNVCPALYDRTVVIHAVSKTYSMTGWRLGWSCGPKWLITPMADIQSQSTSNPTSIAQVAAETALNGDQDCVAEMTVAFKRRHDFLVAGLNEIPGIRCQPSDGTFYAFPDMSGLVAAKGLKDDLELADILLKDRLVALVPGSAFGTPGHMRLSFATSDRVLTECLKRIDAYARS